MRPSENGGFQPNVVMNDRELAQLTFAMRIFDHDVDISYSTRESAEIRNHMATRLGDHHECGKQNGTGRILQLSPNFRAVSCQR